MAGLMKFSSELLLFPLPCDFCIVAFHKEGGEATSATPQFGQNTKHLSGPNNPFLSYMHLVVPARISRGVSISWFKTKKSHHKYLITLGNFIYHYQKLTKLRNTKGDMSMWLEFRCQKIKNLCQNVTFN